MFREALPEMALIFHARGETTDVIQALTHYFLGKIRDGLKPERAMGETISLLSKLIKDSQRHVDCGKAADSGPYSGVRDSEYWNSENQGRVGDSASNHYGFVNADGGPHRGDTPVNMLHPALPHNSSKVKLPQSHQDDDYTYHEQSDAQAPAARKAFAALGPKSSDAAFHDYMGVAMDLPGNVQAHEMHRHEVGTPFGPGVRLVGKQPIASVIYAAGTTALLTQLDLGMEIQDNSFKMSPDNLGLRLATISQVFTRFRFQHAHVIYTPSTGTSTKGNLAMGIADDPALDQFATVNYATTLQLADSRLTQAWSPESVFYENKDDQYYYTEYDKHSNASIRQTAQAEFLIYPSFTPQVADAGTIGTLWICYDLILAEPTMTHGFGLVSSLQKSYTKQLFQQFLRQLSDPLKAITVFESVGLTPPDALGKDNSVVSVLIKEGLMLPPANNSFLQFWRAIVQARETPTKTRPTQRERTIGLSDRSERNNGPPYSGSSPHCT